MRELSTDQRAATDAGADRDVDRSVEISCGAPTRFTEHGSIDVRIESDGHAESACEWTYDVRMAPAGFGRGRDVTIVARVTTQLERAKAAHAERVDLGLRFEERQALLERFARARGRNAPLCAEIVRAGPHCAHELGAAGFDRSVQRHGARVSAAFESRTTRPERRVPRA